ncbi:hypothetical protein [Bradyrhizobium sp. SBR1B]|uniref:hypothetical protein n=1 Tax=Bradyrhizobium sp. SBR1B TaxID=2663836 RepID=UPI001605AFED|nr:hypothetical protein [Bradyrhizobium sp. SBR1B]MBB4383641.1 hypothetical protein [Bradyrhizobium sp. SBR1B]
MISNGPTAGSTRNLVAIDGPTALTEQSRSSETKSNTKMGSVRGVRFDEVDGDILFVYAKDEDTAAKIEDEFALHISIIASKTLEREINVVMVLPRQLVS